MRQASELPEAVRRSFQPWTVAIARTARRDVWLVRDRVTSEPPNDMASVLRHELVHTVLGDMELTLAGGERHVPRWLHEGLAQHIAESIYLSGNEHLVWFRASTDRLLGWHELTDGFPPERDEATLAYAQSASFVAYLYKELGARTILRTIRDYLSGKATNLDDALAKIDSGRSYTLLTGVWIEYMKGRGWVFFLRDNCFNFLIVLAVPLLGFAMYKRFRRERRAGERLEAWEQADRERAEWLRARRGRDELDD